MNAVSSRRFGPLVRSNSAMSHDARRLGRQADVIADEERAAGQQMLAGDRRERRACPPRRSSSNCIARKAVNNTTAARGASCNSPASCIGRLRPGRQSFEHAEVRDRRRQQLRRIRTAKQLKDRRRIDRRTFQSGARHAMVAFLIHRGGRRGTEERVNK